MLLVIGGWQIMYWASEPTGLSSLACRKPETEEQKPKIKDHRPETKEQRIKIQNSKNINCLMRFVICDLRLTIYDF